MGISTAEVVVTFHSIQIGVDLIEVIILITMNQAMAIRAIIVIMSLSMRVAITQRKRKVITPIIPTSRTIVETMVTTGVTIHMDQMGDTTPMVRGRGKWKRSGWSTLATSDMAFEKKTR